MQIAVRSLLSPPDGARNPRIHPEYRGGFLCLGEKAKTPESMSCIERFPLYRGPDEGDLRSTEYCFVWFDLRLTVRKMIMVRGETSQGN